MQYSEEKIKKFAKECSNEENIIKNIANEMFSDKINTTRIGFFLAFARFMIEELPSKKHDIYEEVFNSLYNGIKF